ncbi:MAG: glycosyltransferase family 4 protein [Planctomycetales bacterium]
MSSCSVVYATFDRFPAPKGASTHIRAFASVLGRSCPPVELVTVAGPAPSGRSPAEETVSEGDAEETLLPGVTHTELPALGGTLVERVLNFRTHLSAWWQGRHPRVVHVRSIFEGYPIARQKRAWCDRLVFEVNGLPSIELKYHYPQVADDRELMQKLLAQEQCCLEQADLVLTVSEVNAAYLRHRGVEPHRLRVIPNGVDTDCFHYVPPRPCQDREMELLYSGTLSSWQGVQTAIEALALYRRDAPARLTIVGSGRPGQARRLRELAWQLGVDSFVELVEGVSQSELARRHHAADAILAPLLPNDRNLVQGCCPLKVLEAMASGTPLVASDLPVVRALARPEVDALLVRPGSAKAIKDALHRIRAEPAQAAWRSTNARQRVVTEFTWSLAQQRLIDAYRDLEP